ncbi:hypothetical protein C8J56DRAFT_288480 [Mycena floridula]|nr:hypothetical protein C8J56DRAFT_288480 [Mycena floridula]
MQIDRLLMFLDIAESAVKAIPLVGTILESAIGSSRKMLAIVDSTKTCKASFIQLAERAALITSVVCAEVAKVPGQQDLYLRVSSFVECLREIEIYMESLGHKSLLRRATTTNSVMADIAEFNTRLDDALAVFSVSLLWTIRPDLMISQIRADVNLERLILGLSASQAANTEAILTAIVSLRDTSAADRQLLREEMKLALVQLHSSNSFFFLVDTVFPADLFIVRTHVNMYEHV